MIPIIAAWFAILGAILFALCTFYGLLQPSPISAVMPNVIVDCFSLAVGLIIAELVIRRYRTNRGVEQLAPALIKPLFPVMAAEYDIIKGLDYTPKEFKAIHIEYLEGNMDPINLTADFKSRVRKALTGFPADKITAAVAALEEVKAFTSQFAGSLEPNHLLMLERAHRMWSQFAVVFADPASDNTKLAEAYLDAHDAMSDVANQFNFRGVLEEMRQE